MARWNSLTRFTLHLSLGGALFANAGHGLKFKDVTAEGSTQTQSLRFTGITGGERCGSFHPDAITIETLDGEVLQSWNNPSLSFAQVDAQALTDELHLVFFCAVAIWSYLTIPFLLAHPDVVVEELPPWQEGPETWRRLHARFPSDLITLAPEQILYFDENALQRRVDHELFGQKVACFSWAHDRFGGFVMPTLRRIQSLQADGTAIAKPVLMDVEIFDAVFA